MKAPRLEFVAEIYIHVLPIDAYLKRIKYVKHLIIACGVQGGKL